MSPARHPVAKTYKQFVGGAFVRSESGRTVPIYDARRGFVAHGIHASRKDLRDAIGAARSAQGGWAARSAFNRGQILARVAETLESRRALFEQGLRRQLGWSAREAGRDLDAAVDRAFWYAGWCDKYAQVLGSLNPVASPYFNFSVPEPTGVVVLLASRGSPLVGLVSGLMPILVPGNACVAVCEHDALPLVTDFAEVVATSDVPAGVVNLLTSNRAELARVAADHGDVDAVAAFGPDDEERRQIETRAAGNLKRVAVFEDVPPAAWRKPARQSPYWIERFTELKTAWHPIGV